MKHPVSRLAVLTLVLAMSAAALFTSAAVKAQGGTALTAGSVIAGAISDQARVAIYTFDGTAGTLVTAQVIGTTTGMDPTLSLLSPSQRQLANNNDDPYNGTNDATISYRLTDNGTYSLLVGGSDGSFLLRFTTYASGSSIPLTLNTAVNAALGSGSTLQSYTVTVPDSVSLTFNTAIPGLFYVGRVYNTTGQLVAAVGGTQIAETTLCGAGIYTILLSDADSGAAGAVSLLATGDRSGVCAGAAVVVPPGAPSPIPIIVTGQPISGLCVATSLRDFDINLRRGPSTFNNIDGTLGPRASINVVGRDSTGQWYVNTDNNTQQWVSASVVALSGDCGNLPFVQGPPPPFTWTPVMTATPFYLYPTITPGPIIVIVTPTGRFRRTPRPGDTSTPNVVTATPIVITATPIVVTNTPTP